MGKKRAIFRKIQGVSLALFGGVMLAGVFFGLYYKISHTRSFAAYLPADSVVFFLEGDLSAAERYFPIDRERLAADFFGVNALNFLKNAASWLGRSGGFALIQTENPDSDPVPVYFFEVDRGHTDAARRFDATNDDAILIGRYIVKSRDTDLLIALAEGARRGGPMLGDDPSFVRVSHNLSIFRLAFFYVNPRASFDILLEYDLFADMGPLRELIRPMGDLFRGIGGNIIIGDANSVFVQTYGSLNTPAGPEAGGFHFSRRYGARLLSHIPADSLIAVFGGRRAEFSGTVKSLLGAQFGDYYDDIVGLLDHEYALGLYDGDYVAAAYLNDGDADAARIRRLHDALVGFGGIFAPSERVFTLPDGTKGRELVSDPDNVRVSCAERNDACPVTEIDMAGQDWGIYYTVADNALIFATDKELLGRALQTDASVWYSEGYRLDLEAVLGAGDEAYIINLDALRKKLDPDHAFVKWLKPLPFATVTSSKNRFADGVSTIHYFRK